MGLFKHENFAGYRGKVCGSFQAWDIGGKFWEISRMIFLGKIEGKICRSFEVWEFRGISRTSLCEFSSMKIWRTIKGKFCGTFEAWQSWGYCKNTSLWECSCNILKNFWSMRISKDFRWKSGGMHSSQAWDFRKGILVRRVVGILYRSHLTKVWNLSRLRLRLLLDVLWKFPESLTFLTNLRL